MAESTNKFLQDLLFDHVEALIAYIDIDGIYQCANSTYARWFGLDPTDIVGKSLRAVIGESAYEVIEPRFKQACSGRSTNYETYLFDGEQRKFCQGNYTPHFSPDGVVEGVFVVVTDITHRYDAEFALRQSEQRFQTAFDYAIIGMALMNPQGRWIQVNRSLCEILGYTEAELLQLTVWDVTHTDQHQEAQAGMQELLSDATPVVQVERRYVHKCGALIDVQLSGSLVRALDGSPLHFVLQLQDISARKADERLKREFVSTVSHELRTPLTSISGSLGLLVGGAAGILPDRAARLVSIAQSNSDRLLRLINDILDIEKIESEAAPFSKTSVDLRALAERAMEALRGYTESFSVDLRLAPGDSSLVIGDEDRLMQVLTNLISNAIKFSPTGGHVEMRLTRREEKICFSIRDYGPGVPLEFRGRIFGKFAQADATDTRQRGGTGLGLAIAREIVKKHDGSIWFDSTPGQGATFHIELPTHAGLGDKP
jgi:PAS domain S-box-containing protein